MKCFAPKCSHTLCVQHRGNFLFVRYEKYCHITMQWSVSSNTCPAWSFANCLRPNKHGYCLCEQQKMYKIGRLKKPHKATLRNIFQFRLVFVRLLYPNWATSNVAVWSHWSALNKVYSKTKHIPSHSLEIIYKVRSVH